MQCICRGQPSPDTESRLASILVVCFSTARAPCLSHSNNGPYSCSRVLPLCFTLGLFGSEFVYSLCLSRKQIYDVRDSFFSHGGEAGNMQTCWYIPFETHTHRPCVWCVCGVCVYVWCVYVWCVGHLAAL